VRPVALAAGLLVVAAIWLGPFFGPWREAFSAQMVAHVGLVAIAAPLIVVGLPDRWRAGHAMPAILPVIASLAELLAVWGWHAPSLRGAALGSIPVAVAEQATFLLAGLFLWWTSLARSGERRHAAAGAVALLFTSIHMTLLGALLALSPRPLYGEGDVTCFGLVLDATQDQQLGGVIMLCVGAVVYLIGGVSLVAQLLDGKREAENFRQLLRDPTS